MALMGAIPPPPGVTPNFMNPEHKGEEVVTLGILGVVCSTLFLLLRIYTKIFINRSFKSEDVCVILAWIFSAATVTLIIVGYKHNGEGIHLWNVTTAQFSRYQKFVLTAAVLYVPCLGFAKISILLIFRRIMLDKRLRVAIYIVGAIVISYSVTTAALLIFSCRPYARAWDATITTGSCINRPALYVSTAVSNIVTDLFILIIPIPMVVKLKIPLQQKIGLASMFAVGSLTFITSIVRLVTLKPLLTSMDQTWEVVTPGVWIVIEANLVIICCCFLAVKSFLRHHAPSLIGEKSSEEGYKANSIYQDRHRSPRGLVITKDVDFNLSWQDDSRVRIHQYPTAGSDGKAPYTGTVVEMNDIKQAREGGVTEMKRTPARAGTVVIEEEAGPETPPPPPSRGAKDITPVSHV